jgi:hypothetical protein
LELSNTRARRAKRLGIAEAISRNIVVLPDLAAPTRSTARDPVPLARALRTSVARRLTPGRQNPTVKAIEAHWMTKDAMKTIHKAAKKTNKSGVQTWIAE